MLPSGALGAGGEGGLNWEKNYPRETSLLGGFIADCGGGLGG
jgi:hypothetical protein